MARKSRWNIKPTIDGVQEVEIFSWKYFYDFISQQMPDSKYHIWRGQRCDNWPLRSTLDRILMGRISNVAVLLRERHLEKFQYSVRGRRGTNPPAIENENDWWAIGQHYGLSTPLLDWTTSPFTAAYFAFVQNKAPQTQRRAVWALSRLAILGASKEIKAKFTANGRPPIVEEIRPMSDENSRLVSQGGLFTRAPDGMALDDWIKENFRGSTKFVLRKITIPNEDRAEVLKSLNRMNINHLSLFPDLYGAGVFCNLSLEVPNY